MECSKPPVLDYLQPQAACGVSVNQNASTGCGGTHTLDLPAHRTSDQELTAVVDGDGAEVVTKDSDFVDSQLLRGRPSKLLLISTGKISMTSLGPLGHCWMTLSVRFNQHLLSTRLPSC